MERERERERGEEREREGEKERSSFLAHPLTPATWPTAAMLEAKPVDQACYNNWQHFMYECN